MLLFEFFPAFVMLVSLVVGVWLFVLDRSSRLEADAGAEIQAPRRGEGVAETEERVRQ
jgi:hypothetical protein